ncbi:MAG: AI-2E family transporter [Candidatus Colwellbacteria bacterium]|nr:AI-2E family transporter [Candidatus Colwellbacteria bacterium]
MSRDKAQILFFLGLLAIALGLSFVTVRPYVFGLIFALVSAVIFYPVFKGIKKIVRWESLASLITITLFLAIVIIPTGFFSAQVIQEVRSAYNYFTGTTEGVLALSQVENFINTNILERFFGIQPETEGTFFFNFKGYVRTAFDWFLENFGSFASGAAKTAVNIVVFLFAFFYLLKDGHKVRRAVVKLSPLADKYDQEILSRITSAIHAVIRGSIVIALVQGMLAWIGFTIFGVPSPTLWASGVVMAALIPAIGTSFITIPAVAFLFLQGSIISAVGLLVWALFAVATIDNLLYPHLVGKGARIHPFFILLFAVGGISAFGPMGFVIGPVLLSLLIALVHIYYFLSEAESKLTQS